jgi:hypothetical protein
MSAMAGTTIVGIEFCTDEIQSAIDDGREWLAKGRKLYALQVTCHGLCVAREVYKERGTLPLASKGRFHLLTAREANALVGFELCISEGGNA